MSISLTDVQGFASSPPVQARAPNPIIDDGSFPRSRRSRGLLDPPAEGPALSPSAAPAGTFGSTSAGRSQSAVAANGGGPTTEVNGRGLHSTEGSYYHDSGIVVESWPSGTEGASSQTRSNEFGQFQNNRRSSADARVLDSENLAAGSNGLQGQAVQLVPRRNQVVNANHLLNFNYDPISRPQPRAAPSKTWRPQKVKPYNKDLFLQANYKFVVLDRGSCQMESMDPDKMLNWEDVLCVRFAATFPVQCPICLDNPFCPQITSCGHIYCFPCILQYMLMGEDEQKGERPKKCPLCFMMISTKDLYTISIDNVKQLIVGDHVDFTLLNRSKESVLPTPKHQQISCLVPSSNDNMSDPFSKFVITSDIELSVRESRSDLNDWLYKVDSGLVDDLEKLPYVCVALEQLENRMKNKMEHYSHSGNPLKNHMPASANNMSSQTPNKTVYQGINLKKGSENAKINVQSSASGRKPSSAEHERSNSSIKLGPDNSNSPVAILPELSNTTEKDMAQQDDISLENTVGFKSATEKDSYSFYQATDGQLIILHPLNMKCLLHHYGDYKRLPPSINGKIIELETVKQTEATRRRYRYLSHFSLTTAFQLCEIDLSDVLPSSALAPFMDEIKKREKYRKRLARKEANNDKARADTAVLHGDLSSYDLRQLSLKDVAFSSDDFEALGTTTLPSTSPPVSGDRIRFSDVARLGFASSHDSPSLRVEESAELSQNVGSHVQGPRPMTTLSFANILSSERSVESPESKKSEAGKKGKKPARMLLSTSGGRRY